MPIIRVEKSRDNPYTQIHRDTLQDSSLSWKARGLLAYLLSKPDDWKIQKSHLKEEAPDGKCSLNTTLDELMRAGYIELIASGLGGSKLERIPCLFITNELCLK